MGSTESLCEGWVDGDTLLSRSTPTESGWNVNWSKGVKDLSPLFALGDPKLRSRPGTIPVQLPSFTRVPSHLKSDYGRDPLSPQIHGVVGEGVE